MSIRDRRRPAAPARCALLVIAGCTLLLVSACRGPTIGIVPPSEPITLNINITVQQEVRVKLEDDVSALLDREEGKVQGRSADDGPLAEASAPLAEHEPVVAAAKAAGQVGERYDGLLGIVASPAAEPLRELVASVNAARLDVYQGLSSRRGAPISDVRAIAAKTRIEEARAGEYVMLEPDVWLRR